MHFQSCGNSLEEAQHDHAPVYKANSIKTGINGSVWRNQSGLHKGLSSSLLGMNWNVDYIQARSLSLTSGLDITNAVLAEWAQLPLEGFPQDFEGHLRVEAVIVQSGATS